MDAIIEAINVDVPFWVAFFIPIIQLLIAGRLVGLSRGANNTLARWFRRWLGVYRQVSLTQEAYDQLEKKDEETLYLIGKPKK